MPIKLADVSSQQPLPLRLLQIGDTGTGKSLRAADATRWGRVYFFDFDGKMKILADSLPAAQKALIDFDTYTDVESAIRFADSLLKDCPYQTIVVDTISVFNELAEEHAKVKGKIPIDGKLSYEGWDYIRNLCNELYFKRLHKLPCNVIVNCHVEKSKDLEGKEVLAAAGRGSFINGLPRRMTDVQYLAFSGGKYVVKAKKSERIATNSFVAPEFVDALGNLKVLDLSVFDGRVMTEKK